MKNEWQALKKILKELARKNKKIYSIPDSDYTFIDTDELTKLRTWEIQSVETIQDKEAAIQELTARLDRCLDKSEIDQKINQIMWILRTIVEVIDEKKSWGFDMSEESKAKMKEFLVNPDIFINKNL